MCEGRPGDGLYPSRLKFAAAVRSIGTWLLGRYCLQLQSLLATVQRGR